jgi:DNA-directed RNA polymerase subunit M/transcription elongation factor TFIIS
MSKLLRKEKASGIPYREHLRREILMARRFKERSVQRYVTCPKCGLKQLPSTNVDCPKCQYNGAVIPDLYSF